MYVRVRIYVCITFTFSCSSAPSLRSVCLTTQRTVIYVTAIEETWSAKTPPPSSSAHGRGRRLHTLCPAFLLDGLRCLGGLDHSRIKGVRRATRRALPLREEQGAGSQSNSTLLHPYPRPDCLCSRSRSCSCSSVGKLFRSGWANFLGGNGTAKLVFD